MIIDFFFLRDDGGGRERERNLDWLPPTRPDQGPTPQPRCVPDWESNPHTFGVGDDAAINRTTRAGPKLSFLTLVF